MPPQRVGFLRCFGLKTGINFAHFGLESGMVFQGTSCKGEKRTYLSRAVIKKRGPGISPRYFQRKIEEKIEREKSVAV